MTDTFTASELRAVVRWLEAREQWLLHIRQGLECGDDFAIAVGKGPEIRKLADEARAARASKATAQDQLADAAAKEPHE